MVKLIRLSTEDRTANFDSKFNQDIELKPYSRIALDNAILETDNEDIIIDGKNDNITFQLQSNKQHIVTLDHTNTADLPSYNRNNFSSLFKNMAVRINAEIGAPFISPPSAYNISKELGTQVQVEIGQSKKVNITFRQSPMNSREEDLTANRPLRTISGVANTPVLSTYTLPYGGVNETRYTKPPTTTPANNNTFMTYYDKPLTRGCGAFRATPAKLSVVGNGAGDDTDYANGLIIGVARVPFGTYIRKRDFLNGDMFLGAHIGSTTGLITTIQAGAFVRTATRGTYTADGNTNNDVYEIMTVDGKLKLNLYQGADSVVTLLEQDYDHDVKLYPFIVIRGTGSGAAADGSDNDAWNNIMITGDPFEEKRTSVLNLEDNHNIEPYKLETRTILGAPTQQSGARGPGFIRFQGISLANFLGFENLRVPLTDFNRASNYWFYRGDEVFTYTNLSKSVVVILDNIQLDSYDTVEEDGGDGGRRNILATVPRSDTTGGILYEVINHKFINVNNAYPIKLRNIRARIVQNDLSELLVRGVSRMTILIKDEKEN